MEITSLDEEESEGCFFLFDGFFNILWSCLQNIQLCVTQMDFVEGLIVPVLNFLMGKRGTEKK